MKLLLGLFAALFTLSANASVFDGSYVGLGLDRNSVQHRVEIKGSNFDQTVGSIGEDTKVHIGGALFAGYGKKFENGAYAGIEAQVYYPVKKRYYFADQYGDSNINYSVKPTAGLNGRFGIVGSNDKYMGYIIIGAEAAKYKIDNTADYEAGGTQFGAKSGIGFEYALCEKTKLRLEMYQVAYKQKTLDVGNGGFFEFKPVNNVARIGFSYAL